LIPISFNVEIEYPASNMPREDIRELIMEYKKSIEETLAEFDGDYKVIVVTMP
jgi:hypothetical protein